MGNTTSIRSSIQHKIRELQDEISKLNKALTRNIALEKSRSDPDNDHAYQDAVFLRAQRAQRLADMEWVQTHLKRHKESLQNNIEEKKKLLEMLKTDKVRRVLAMMRGMEGQDFYDDDVIKIINEHLKFNLLPAEGSKPKPSQAHGLAGLPGPTKVIKVKQGLSNEDLDEMETIEGSGGTKKKHTKKKHKKKHTKKKHKKKHTKKKRKLSTRAPKSTRTPSRVR